MSEKKSKRFNFRFRSVWVQFLFLGILGLALFITVSSSASSVIISENNAVLYYPLDNQKEFGESKVRVHDFSNNSNDGKVVGATPSPSGKLGGAFNFDGINDKISIADSPKLSPSSTNQFSIGLWVKFSKTSFVGEGSNKDYINFLGKGDSRNGYEYTFRQYSSASKQSPNRISFSLFNLKGGVGATASVQEPIKTGEWMHLLAVYNGSDLELWKNGILKDTVSVKLSGVTPKDGKAPLNLGTRDGNSYFRGGMDEFIVYNKALSSLEIKQLYDNDYSDGTLNNTIPTSANTSSLNNSTTTAPNTTISISSTSSGSGSGSGSSSPAPAQTPSPETTPDTSSNTTTDSTEETNPTTNTTATNSSTIANSTTQTPISSDNNVVQPPIVTAPKTETSLNLPESLNNGLKLYYKFNNQEGESLTAVKDLSGNSNNGAVENSIWNSEGGKFGDGAFEFNGINSKIETKDSPDLSPANSKQQITISFWLRPDSFNFKGDSQGYVHFLGKGTPNNHEYAFRIYNSTAVDSVSRSKRISFYAFNLEGGLGAGSYFQDDLKAGEWIYVTGVIDGLNTKIYKNGVLRDKDKLSGYNIAMKDGAAPFGIATKDLKTWFKGSLDELRVYNRVLTDSEILALYNARPSLA